MVRLEKLVIQGFKSFKRKASVPFPPGFSVITGPNGSGKSNISDAICFVLGTSKSRTLRAKKTQDLVFHGSKNKPGSDYANVTLHFDNSDKILPFKERSISISRRLNKKGVSTYRLNGKVVTRQQIVDIFSQAHIQPDGHNIIQQGDVNQIVEMDATERREIIDEISGISEYDEKKQKAEKELGKIEEKIREAEIILQEKTQIMEKIRKERDAALEYKRLESDLEKIRASLIWKAYTGSENSLKRVDDKLAEKTAESDKLEKEIKDLDKRLAEEENKLESLTRNVIKASSQIEVTKRVARLQSEIERLRDKIESEGREIRRLEDMMEKLKTMDRRVNPAVKAVLNMKGVCGKLSDLIDIPKEYVVAVEVAAGAHMQDVVVDSMDAAVKCVKYLKKNRVGRARFLPLNIRSSIKKPLPPGAIGWLSNLIKREPKYAAVVEHVLGTTACVENIDMAKDINKKYRIRMVTLDGDLLEASGAVTGGFYKKSVVAPEINKYADQKKRIENGIRDMEIQLKGMNKELEELAEKERKTQSISLEKDRIRITEALNKVREKRNSFYERRLILQQEIGKLNIQKARLEAQSENLKLQWKKKKDLKPEKLKPFVDMGVSLLKEKEAEITDKMGILGIVNLKAIEDFDAIKTEFDEFKGKVDKIVEERGIILDTINKIEMKRRETFNHTMREISRNFKQIYSELTNGDAELALDDPENIESGLLIKASPPGKRLLHIDSMSGGEKTLTAFAFLFAIQKHRPAPFYILDEADTTLDSINTKRIVKLLKKQSKETQFIIISHNDTLVREADQIYGITMEDGESKIMGIELPKENN